MFTFVFTPRGSAEVPVQLGPVPGVLIDCDVMRHADSHLVLAKHEQGQWVLAGERFYRADCTGHLTITLDDCNAATKPFGPFRHFSLSDGVAYVDRSVFAQLNSAKCWYVERVKLECRALLLLPVQVPGTVPDGSAST